MDPDQLPRLLSIEHDTHRLLAEARANGWDGGVFGLETTLQAIAEKKAQVRRLQATSDSRQVVWARTGVRPLVRYEAPKGRRVNVITALAPFGPAPRPVWASSQGKLDATAFLDFVCGKVADLPGGAAGLTALPAGWGGTAGA